MAVDPSASRPRHASPLTADLGEADVLPAEI
jgi:hypothetical protein